MPDNAEPYKFSCDQADQFRQQDGRRQADDQCQNAALDIFCQQHGKQLRAAHSHHQADAEFMPAPFQLKSSGIIYEEK